MDPKNYGKNICGFPFDYEDSCCACYIEKMKPPATKQFLCSACGDVQVPFAVSIFFTSKRASNVSGNLATKSKFIDTQYDVGRNRNSTWSYPLHSYVQIWNEI